MFYERYLELCARVRLSPSTAATNAGFNRGTVSVWKKKHEAGLDVRPERDVIEKICKYFGCSETWLLGIDEQKEKPTSQRGGRDYADDVMIEAFRNADESTKEAIRLLLKLR